MPNEINLNEDDAVCSRCNGRGRVKENRGKRSVPVCYMKPCPECDPQIRRENAARRKKVAENG